jgi:large subunit ribosomal protein L19
MSTALIIDRINAAAIRTDLPRMDIGDTINVHCKIVEGDKKRIQIFQGVLMARAGHQITEMITVRRIVEEVGVERVFPINSPNIEKIEVVRRGQANRAKLYYLRDRQGKSRRIIDRRRKLKHVAGQKLAGQV